MCILFNNPSIFLEASSVKSLRVGGAKKSGFAITFRARQRAYARTIGMNYNAPCVLALR